MHGFILVGIYGSGKNGLVSCGRHLLEPFHHFSSGNYFRTEIERGSALGELIQGDVAAGQYVSDPTVNAVCEQELPGVLSFSKSVWLDGVPRTTGQVEYLFEDFFPRNGVSIEDFSLIHVATPEEECTKRAHRQGDDPTRSGRIDAKIESALSRIAKDVEVIPSLLDHLKSKIPASRQFEFDGTNMRSEAPMFIRQLGLPIRDGGVETYLDSIRTDHPNCAARAKELFSAA